MFSVNLKGLLSVKVVQGKGFEKCDPYVVLNVDTKSDKTHTGVSGTSCVWNKELQIPITGSESKMSLVLMNHDIITRDYKVGSLDMALSEFLNDYNIKGSTWVTLDDGSKLEIQVVFYRRQD